MRILDWFRVKEDLVKEVWGLRTAISGLQMDVEYAEGEAARLEALLVEEKEAIHKFREEIHLERMNFTQEIYGLQRKLGKQVPTLERKLPQARAKDNKLELWQAAQLMQVSSSTLKHYAYTGRGPKAHDDGEGSYFYYPHEVKEYMDQKKKNLAKPRGKRNAK